MIKNTDERLVHLEGFNGLRIDPGTIALVLPLANLHGYEAPDGKNYYAKVMIETRGGGRWTVPCWDLDEAESLARELHRLANDRNARLRPDSMARPENEEFAHR